MPALCFLNVRAYYAKRICRILCESLMVMAHIQTKEMTLNNEAKKQVSAKMA